MRHETAFGMVLVTLCAGAPVAYADDIAAAKLIFDQGVENWKAQKYDIGCPQLAESVKLDRRPGALYTLARCEADWGRIATAVARYDEYLQLYDKLADAEKAKQAERRADAQERRDKLAPDVPHWTITLSTNAPPNTEIKRNGESFGHALLGLQLPVDPGVHVFTTQVHGGRVTEKRVEILKGTDTPIVLDVDLPPVATTTVLSDKPLQEENPTHPRRTAGWVFVGVGGVFLGGGLIAGATVLSNKNVMDGNCGAAVGHPESPTLCGDAGRAAGESVNVAAPLANIGVFGGLASLATGVILLATAPKASLPKKVGVTRTASIDVRPVHSGGVMGTVRGTW